MKGVPMIVDIRNDNDLDMLIESDEISRLCELSLSVLGIARDASVSVSFVDDDTMHELNYEWRGIDAPTDVLSFECDSVFDSAIPDDEPVELGDIVLAPLVIAGQAAVYSNAPDDEMRLMLVHGMMHLLGFDHVDEAGALEMEAHELDVLKRAAALRGADPASVVIGPTTRHDPERGQL